jgi:RNA polymerase sigma-54 factor
MQTLSQHLSLLQKLTPQQVQYLKLLQLPVLSLEQRIKEELELNPVLEEGEGEDREAEAAEEPSEPEKGEAVEVAEVAEVEVPTTAEKVKEDEGYTIDDYMNDDLSGFKTPGYRMDDEEREDLPLPEELSLVQHLTEQLRMLNLTPDEELLGEEIIGNIDEDGYLRRELEKITQDINLERGLAITPQVSEHVLAKIQRLDPAGVAARTLQECLLVQMELKDECPPALKALAVSILRDHWEQFSLKHFDEMAKALKVDLNRLKLAIEQIQKLNPKPGEGEFSPQQNYLIPDFLVERDGDDFVISLNDRNVPPLRINKSYKKLMSRRKVNGTPTEVKDFLKKQFDSAKWFITAIYQRRDTMMKVMRAIVERQREFFETGTGLKPMIYRDISEPVGVDISTISRVVNGKYVQTEYGVHELRYFFGDSIKTNSGEEVSNKEVKKLIKEIIEKENPDHPLSDDRIGEMLRADNLNIARRTVAKYREALKIPVARMRRKI